MEESEAQIFTSIVEKGEDQIAELTRRLEEITNQIKQTYTETLKKNTREFMIKTKARMEAAANDALDTLKVNLAKYKRVQQMSIKEFCLGHTRNLQIDPVGDASNMKGIPDGVWFPNKSSVSLLNDPWNGMG
jgi:iron uptake system EfeUOB component EfeO/EfeM